MRVCVCNVSFGARQFDKSHHKTISRGSLEAPEHSNCDDMHPG